MWRYSGGIEVVDVPVTAFIEIAHTIEKYADHDIDFTDATLVWLANKFQQQQILTVDKADFSSFRLNNSQWFHVLEWFQATI